MGSQAGNETVGCLWQSGPGVTNAQRAVAQETVLALDRTTGAEGDKDPEG